MNKKYLTEEENEDLSDDYKSSMNLSYNNDLFDDDSYVPHPLVTARRVKLPKNGENWEVLDNNKVAVTLIGLHLSSEIKNFLKTPQGLLSLIKIYKSGNKSSEKIQKQLKKML